LPKTDIFAPVRRPVQGLLASARQIPLRGVLSEHGTALLVLAVLTCLVTWPTIPEFTRKLVSIGGDAKHNLWVLWHYKEALLGREPFFETALLYYPIGANLLTHGLGPVLTVFSLPFWPLGLEGAHNGTVLVSVWLTGYFMYVLARGFGFDRRMALFAGVFLLMAPMHLAGLYGHMTKVFLGLLPLSILALHRALDVERSRRWIAVTALVLLLTLLHSGYQFVFAGMALLFLATIRLFTTRGEQRRQLLLRLALIAGASAVLAGPLLLAMLRASADPTIYVDYRQEAVYYHADLAEFLLPFETSLLFGTATANFMRENGIAPTIETSVYLTWTGIVLTLAAAASRVRSARKWIVLATLLVLLSAGPFLKILTQSKFTVYQLDIMLPFALVSELPGLSFMRIPGRYMMLGYVALSVTAAYGLAWMVGRSRKAAWPVFLAAGLLLLVETWPKPWPMEPLRPMPDFYRTIAADAELYGVMDLPFQVHPALPHVVYSAHHQRYQMEHRKGVVDGYLSRTYSIHPLFPCIIPVVATELPDVLVNDVPTNCSDNLLFDLAYYNYRYVVRHKPDPGYMYYRPGTFGEEQAQYIVETFFEGQEPLVDDGLVTVYAVPPVGDLQHLEPAMSLGTGWGGLVDGRRWARSPATLRLSVPRPMQGVLHITPAEMYVPTAEGLVGDQGRLTIELPGGFSTTVDLITDENTAVLLDLPAGVYDLTLSLEEGNFSVPDSPGALRSFATRWLNLQTIETVHSGTAGSGD
jgi:hypothetical protein